MRKHFEVLKHHTHETDWCKFWCKECFILNSGNKTLTDALGDTGRETKKIV